MCTVEAACMSSIVITIERCGLVVLGEAQRCAKCEVLGLSSNMDALGGTSLSSPRSLVSLVGLGTLWLIAVPLHPSKAPDSAGKVLL